MVPSEVSCRVVSGQLLAARMDICHNGALYYPTPVPVISSCNENCPAIGLGILGLEYLASLPSQTVGRTDCAYPARTIPAPRRGLGPDNGISGRAHGIQMPGARWLAKSSLWSGCQGTVGGHVRSVTRSHQGSTRTFGEGWQDRMERKPSSEAQGRTQTQRWTWCLPPAPGPRRERDLSFWTIPASLGHEQRQLL